MSGVWVFNGKGVARLITNPTKESFETKEPTTSGSATAPGARRRVLVYLPENQVITCYEELDQRLHELGWVIYNNPHKPPHLIQYHQCPCSIDLISLPKDFAKFKTQHMYDIVVKNSPYFIVRDA
ncbi:Flowering-promoting factor 1-like protein [Thalictrum thalictroides]|uniref:Flowering-promoting factor 1-like protein n=1 Tax=Thalictrum thalictroides TaxID=46969 RepID=A0A7J6X5N0_THATH|nr:Flowering-promoting factor 1-like protein [Thalictrum thalictroides]